MSKESIFYTRGPDARKSIHNYIANRAPLLGSPLAALPPGSVRAGGWLKKQLDLMCCGMAGRLKELSHYLADDNGWFGGPGDGWEEQPYWLRGFYTLGVLTGERGICEESERWIEKVIASAQPDGYFGPACCKEAPWFGGKTVADIWPHMVMLDALRTHSEAAGDARVLKLMEGFFGWCAALPDSKLLPPFKNIDESFYDNSIPVSIRAYIGAQRSGEMLPHIYWLYNRIGGAWLLKLAERIVKLAYPPSGEFLDRHCVNFAQRFRFSGSYYIQSGNKADLEESEYWYQKHMNTWGQMPGGGYAADECTREGYTDPRQAFETCAMAELNKSFYILGEITAGTVYADRCEEVTFNSLPVSMTPDLRAVHYLTAANQPMLDSNPRHGYFNGSVRMLDYRPGEHYRCCQHNVTQAWPEFTRHLWMAAAGGGLAAWMYADSCVTALAGNGERVVITEETGYPFDTHIRFRVDPDAPVFFPLYLRVPGWAGEARLELNGEPAPIQGSPGGFAAIERLWQKGDALSVCFPQRISVKKWEKNAGSVTVNRGPLSYSLKIKEEWHRCGGTDEWPEYEVLPGSAWNCGLVLDERNPAGIIRVTREDAPGDMPWAPEGAPIELEAVGKRIPDWGLTDNTVEPLRQSPVKSNEHEERISLIPMGCARLRMCCLPVIGSGPGASEWKAYPRRA